MNPREEYAAAAAEARRQMKELQEQLRKSDAIGDRKASTALLGRLLDLQQHFFSTWCKEKHPPASSSASQPEAKPGEVAAKVAAQAQARTHQPGRRA